MISYKGYVDGIKPLKSESPPGIYRIIPEDKKLFSVELHIKEGENLYDRLEEIYNPNEKIYLEGPIKSKLEESVA